MEEITQELVKQLFDYKDGILYWKISRTHRVKIGDIAGSITLHGKYYRRIIRIGQGHFYASRLTFLWHKGYFPLVVDHKDRNTLNNKIENLRDADKSKNSMNKTPQKGKTSCYLGVHFCKRYEKKPWVAQIQILGKRKWIGSFATEKEAAGAYNKSAEYYYGEFANLNIV